MEHETLKLIGESWDYINEHSKKEFINDFYQNFIDTNPQYKPLFSDDMEQQKKKMAQTLSLVCRIGDNEETTASHMQRIAMMHEKYNLTDEDLYNFLQSLLVTLKKHYIEHWNDEHEQAWRKGFHNCILKHFVAQ